MIGNAKTFIAVSGDFIGSEPADVLQAINTYGVPVIIYEPGDNTKLVEEIRRVSEKTLASPLLYVASDLDSFKEIVKTIEKMQDNTAASKHPSLRRRR
jgi:ABC-type Zn uptake system ZnuABC Zn-binding protein ZnuA